MASAQATLPFSKAVTRQPVKRTRLRGAWADLRFTADGGLLEPLNLPRDLLHEPLEYARPPEFILEHNPLGNPDEAPDEEQVAAYVEATADTLFQLIQEAAEIGRVARRFDRPRASHQHIDVAAALRDEINHLNLLYAETLEEYNLIMGTDDANALDHWLNQLADYFDALQHALPRTWNEGTRMAEPV